MRFWVLKVALSVLSIGGAVGDGKGFASVWGREEERRAFVHAYVAPVV